MPSGLQRELILINVLAWCGLLAGGVVLSVTWGIQAAIQWLLQSCLIWLFVYYQTAARVDLNRPAADAPIYNNLGWGNRLTVLRGVLIAATGGFLFQDWPPFYLAWMPGMVYMLAAILDRLDGYAARKTSQTSLLGTELDTVLDALGLAIAPLLAVWYGQVHWSYLLFSIAYYLFTWGLYWRRRNGLPVRELKPNAHRRAWAGFQMGFIAVVLLPWFQPPATTLAGFAFMLPVIIGFIIDWLTVSTRINPYEPPIAMVFDRLESYSQMVLQPALRLVIAGGALLIVQPPAGWCEYAMLVAAGFIFMGVLVRLFALLFIALLGWYHLEQVLDFPAALLLVSAIWLLMLGGGRYSLWRWDDDWVNRYDGA
jgi:CDP-diacylglycerol--glycerol-3-phosphate 3-phosphatidyltransferase